METKLNGLDFSSLDDHSHATLEQKFFKEEINENLMHCSKNKAPVSDGSNIGFLQRFWYVIKDDIIELFNNFH